MPDETNNEELTTVIFKSEPSLIDALDERARRNDRTRSGELRAILRSVLEQNREASNA